VTSTRLGLEIPGPVAFISESKICCSIFKMEEELCRLQASVTTQASLVRQLKKDKASSDAIADGVAILVDLRAKLAEMEKSLQGEEDTFNRKAFDELLLRKMYIVPSFEIHNGPAGFFDYGPPACALKANILSQWREHFPMEDNMLEMECTNLTPSSVLETSGHVERFTDFMVRDEKTGEGFRADKLLEDGIDAFLEANPSMPIDEKESHRVIQRQADAFPAEELHQMLIKYNIKSPSNKENGLTFPFPFNLMFKTTIGPEGTQVGFLRPETAQGLFVNFKRLLEYNQARMPFAAAQIGTGFRNEINPRNGLLRVREFCMAEIEHFVHPEKKNHPKFSLVADTNLVLFTADAQLTTGKTVEMTIGEAVRSGLVANETLGYFMSRTQKFLLKIGVDAKRLRFRQHLCTEMAHYAADCWDAEIKLSYGWIECVGHADRACYDLLCHSEKTGVPLVAAERLEKPIMIDKIICEPNKRLLGPKFKGDQKKVIALLEGLDGAELDAFKSKIEKEGTALVGDFEIDTSLVTFKAEKRNIFEAKFAPHVIEPSFGIGRIVYSVMEHSFGQRENDDSRCIMNLKPCVAGVKLGIFRLVNNNAGMDAVVEKIRRQMRDGAINVRVDSTSGTIGRRYSRADELGIPFGVTVDFDTLVDNTVTLRDRTSMSQVRLPLGDLSHVVAQLVSENLTWETVSTMFVVVNQGTDEDDKNAETKGAGAKSTDRITLERTARATFYRPNFDLL
jgi:glycyl-tRNA synthetase